MSKTVMEKPKHQVRADRIGCCPFLCSIFVFIIFLVLSLSVAFFFLTHNFPSVLESYKYILSPVISFVFIIFFQLISNNLNKKLGRLHHTCFPGTIKTCTTIFGFTNFLIVCISLLWTFDEDKATTLIETLLDRTLAASTIKKGLALLSGIAMFITGLEGWILLVDACASIKESPPLSPVVKLIRPKQTQPQSPGHVIHSPMSSPVIPVSPVVMQPVIAMPGIY
eukprot:gnl/Dysnectes_brevis/1830_a2100_2178.p1 GENE.gnl/Dysnectes_brevis/1830_a2100_2178~~gnl/Dysnectes_brevis/1830_a2100_2178.p1  ORF type:complete len:224 (-),score=52.55 gnl/Dysnectes_brevis/1830_a2100_2178:68-739(-)